MASPPHFRFFISRRPVGPEREILKWDLSVCPCVTFRFRTITKKVLLRFSSCLVHIVQCHERMTPIDFGSNRMSVCASICHFSFIFSCFGGFFSRNFLTMLDMKKCMMGFFVELIKADLLMSAMSS